MQTPVHDGQFEIEKQPVRPKRCGKQQRQFSNDDLPSLVMKEMNSLTHSCMHSLASFAILALSGKAFFIMRATGAKFRMLASNSSTLSPLEDVDEPGAAQEASTKAKDESSTMTR
jgi:hypothetical protein